MKIVMSTVNIVKNRKVQGTTIDYLIGNKEKNCLKELIVCFV